jgi:hypothetical protein
MASQSNTIAILDDEPDRVAAMLPCLAKTCPRHETAIFDNAPAMIEWLAVHCGEAILICLDHDLGPNRTDNGATLDPGTGRDAVDFLSTKMPSCPVIVHTTNYLAAPGMMRVLEESGWTASRVSPYGDLDWIGEVWIDEARRALALR